MFSFFGKKKSDAEVVDMVWTTTDYKLNGCVEHLRKHPATVFIAWFPETVDSVDAYLQQQGYTHKVMLYKEATIADAGNYVFIEHYPLPEKEKQLYQKLSISKPLVFSALDEPLFKAFGSDKILATLQMLGIRPHEVIQHKLISSAIQKAQQKLEAKVPFDDGARSQHAWMEKYN